jgi:hypothetical protein
VLDHDPSSSARSAQRSGARRTSTRVLCPS